MVSVACVASRSGSAGDGSAFDGAEPPVRLRILPREMRLMSERILSLTALPKGFVLAIKDLPMYSQLLGLGGFALLEARLERLRGADPTRLRIEKERGPRLHLDAGGEHAWIVVPSLLDLAAELAQRYGSAQIRVSSLSDAAELESAIALAGRTGLKLRRLHEPLGALEASVAELTGDMRQDDPVLWAALEHGTPIASELWWRIYQLAKQALEPDNPVSRRHAGTVMVLDDGRVLGRADGDDETDFSFIASGAPSPPGAGDGSA